MTMLYANCEMWRYEAYNLYNASASRNAEPKRVDEATISLEATYVDSIEEVCSTFLQERGFEHTWQALQAWHQIEHQRNASNMPSSGLAREGGPFWRTVMGDVFRTGEKKWRRITSHDKLGRSDIENSAHWPVDTKQTFLGDGDPFLELRIMTHRAATNGRTMFWTKKGSMGLCFPNSQPGDEIWVLHGGKVPFVLRPCTSKGEGNTTGNRGYHNLIGEVYLHGYMDGEAMRGSDYASTTVFLQ
jgi:hypothetical protein